MMLQSREIILSGMGDMPVTVDHYPDGMPLVSPSDRSPHYNTLILRPKSLESFVAAMFLVDARAERGQKTPRLILPHVPGSRQDRLNPYGDYLFTLKSIAKMINDRNFEQVDILDPHSTVTPALIDRAVVHTAEDILADSLTSAFDAVIAPDAGAAKRAFEVASLMDLPFLQAEKHRNVSDGSLSGFACSSLEIDKHYLVVDDICDGGGTFLGLADVIARAGATASLYVTHGIFSKGLDTLLEKYDKVYTTDSTVYNHTGAEVIRYTYNISCS